MEKFFDLHQTLKPFERREFQLFVEDTDNRKFSWDLPMINKYKLLVLHFMPFFDSGKLTVVDQSLKERAWGMINPDIPFNSKVLSAGFSPFTRMLESFIGLKEFRRQVMEGELPHLILSGLRARNTVKKGSLIKRLVNLPSKSVYWSADELLAFHKLYLECYNDLTLDARLFKSSEFVDQESFLVLAMDYLKQSSALFELRALCSILFNHLFSEGVGGSLAESIYEAPAIRDSWKDQNYLFLFYENLFQLLRDPSVHHWELYANELCKADLPEEIGEGRELLRYAISAGLRLRKLKEFPESARKTLSLVYQKGMTSGVLLVGGYLPLQHYINACVLALDLNDLEFANWVTKALLVYLRTNDREEAPEFFNLALISFYKEEYAQAWNELRKFNPKDIRKLNTYVLKIKILSFLDGDLLEAHLESFRKFLERNDGGYDENRYCLEKTRLSIIKGILALTPGNPSEFSALEGRINDFGHDQKWLKDFLTHKYSTLV